MRLVHLDPEPLASAEQVSQHFRTAWTTFAHTGNPNGDRNGTKTPHWPRFRDAADVLSLDLGPNGIVPKDINAASNCAFWASLT